MAYTFKKNILFFDDREIYTAPGNILKCITDEFKNNSYVLYDPSEYMPEGDYPIQFPPDIHDPEIRKIVNCNVLCISSVGKDIWRIEPTPNRPLQYISIYNHLGDLWAKRMDNDEFRVDRTTGKILEQHLGI